MADKLQQLSLTVLSEFINRMADKLQQLSLTVLSGFINRIADKLQQLTVKSQGVYFFRTRCTTAFGLSAVNEKPRIAQEHRLNLTEFKGNCKWIWATLQHVNSLEMRR